MAYILFAQITCYSWLSNYRRISPCSTHAKKQAHEVERMNAQQAFVAGARATVPLLLGILPWGVIAGITAVNVGLSPVQMIGMSFLIFAGASQLAIIGLIGQTAPIAVVVLTAVVIDLRHLMYSASIAPFFRQYDRATKWFGAYFLNDETYAVSITEFRTATSDVQSRKPFYFGSGIAMLATWVGSTGIGAVLGANVPPGLSLEFAIPLTYIALLFSTLDDRLTEIAALVAGGVSILAAALPFNLGLMTAALVGIGTGVGVELRQGTFPTTDHAPNTDGEVTVTNGDEAT